MLFKTIFGHKECQKHNPKYINVEARKPKCHRGCKFIKESD